MYLLDFFFVQKIKTFNINKNYHFLDNTGLDLKIETTFVLIIELNFKMKQKKRFKYLTYLFFAAAALSLWRRFLNQFPTCVGVRPVA